MSVQIIVNSASKNSTVPYKNNSAYFANGIKYAQQQNAQRPNNIKRKLSQDILACLFAI
jgi:hypothetical protein